VRLSLASVATLCILVVGVCWFARGLSAQNAPATSVSTPMGDTGMTQIAVPGGAGATVTPSGQPSAGPIIGFQVWQQDKYLLSSFFTFSVPQTFSGQPPVSPQTVSAQQNSFGVLLLNPPGQGTSYTFIGNKVWGLYPSGGVAPVGGKTVADAFLFLGFEARGGITTTNWTEQTSTPTTLGATIGYFAPEFLMTSKTYNFQANAARARINTNSGLL